MKVDELMENFWNKLEKPFFALAPMEDVTNTVFRHVVQTAARPDLFFTEFTNVSAFCHPEGQMSVRGRLAFTEDEKPLLAHIWGNKAEEYEQMSFALKDMGFSGIDLNMGCPVKNVVKTYNGSGLIKKPELAAKLIEAAKVSGLPVSVKTRLGYSDLDEAYTWLPHLLKQDIVNLSIHLRTRDEMSDYPAHYEYIPDILKMRDEIAPDTLITINGDIANRQAGLDLVEKYPGIDGIMIGRGIFQDPFAFEKEPRKHKASELIDLFRLHLDLFDKFQEEYEDAKFLPLRRFFKIYVRNIPHAKDLRAALMETMSTDEARALIDQFAKEHPEALDLYV